MNVFLVYAHAEPQSFNGALFQTAQDTLRGAGHAVVVSWITRLRRIEMEQPIDAGEY